MTTPDAIAQQSEKVNIARVHLRLEVKKLEDLIALAKANQAGLGGDREGGVDG